MPAGSEKIQIMLLVSASIKRYRQNFTESLNLLYFRGKKIEIQGMTDLSSYLHYIVGILQKDVFFMPAGHT